MKYTNKATTHELNTYNFEHVMGLQRDREMACPSVGSSGSETQREQHCVLQLGSWNLSDWLTVAWKEMQMGS